MRFSLTKEHKEFFYKHLFIEFEEVLSPDQIASLKVSIQHVMAKRDSKIYKEGTPLIGRDLFRDDKDIRKFILSKNFAHVVKDLCSKDSLRMAFDQYLNPKKTGPKFFSKLSSFKEASCLADTYAILIFKLSGKEFTRPEEGPFLPSPHKVGSLLIVHPDKILNFEGLLESSDDELYIITYGSDKLLYRPSNLDPAEPLIKRMGYAYGDLMKEQTHPIVYR